MSLEKDLLARSGSKCELCTSGGTLSVYEIPPVSNVNVDTSVIVCETCLAQINSKELDQNHWRVLSDTMWSEHAPVQVMAYRMLKRLGAETWAQDLSEQLYLDDELLKFAQSFEVESKDSDKAVITKDSNGTQLLDGDTVTLIKDLDVKGAGFTAKRGTVVKNITLTSNPLHIEGKVNGIGIVLVAAYLKKVVA
jgi:protein PhnA